MSRAGAGDGMHAPVWAAHVHATPGAGGGTPALPVPAGTGSCGTASALLLGSGWVLGASSGSWLPPAAGLRGQVDVQTGGTAVSAAFLGRCFGPVLVLNDVHRSQMARRAYARWFPLPPRHPRSPRSHQLRQLHQLGDLLRRGGGRGAWWPRAGGLLTERRCKQFHRAPPSPRRMWGGNRRENEAVGAQLAAWGG